MWGEVHVLEGPVAVVDAEHAHQLHDQRPPQPRQQVQAAPPPPPSPTPPHPPTRAQADPRGVRAARARKDAQGRV